MKNLDKHAGKGYHSKQINEPRYDVMARSMRDIYLNQRKEAHPPVSVLDVGCSCGALLKSFESLGKFERLAGIEVSEHVKEMWQPKNAELIQHDLSAAPVTIADKFDIVVCQEVAGHLELDSMLFSLLDGIPSENGLLFFGAAHPGQRGKGHINCHWTPHWRDQITAYGRGKAWFYNHNMSMQFAHDIGASGLNMHCYLNTMVFQHATDPESEDGLRHE